MMLLTAVLLLAACTDADEATDALVIIVSEETGTISVADKGMLKRHLAPETLRKLLTQELLIEESSRPQDLLSRLRQRLRPEEKK